MDTVTIRNEIHVAESHETNTRELALLLHRRFQHLYPRVPGMPPADRDEHLYRFVRDFINRTPNLLDTLLEAARGSPREDLCDTVAEICLDFFMSPPPLLYGRRGMNGVLGKAYLCHRIIEELNDCCRLCGAQPLLPVDLCCSNLVAHQVIGKPLASLLDELVHNTVRRLQDLAGTNLCCVPSAETGWRLERLCRRRSLLDEAITPGFCTSSYPSGCTIH